LLKRLLVLLAFCGAQSAAAQTADAKQAELDALKRRLQALQQEYRNTQAHRREAADELRAFEQAISATVRKMRELDDERQRSQGDLRSIAHRAETTAARMREQQGALAASLRAAYRRGHGDALKLILEGADPNQTARQLRYLGYVSRARQGVIASLRADQATLVELEREASQEAARLRQLQAAREAEQTRLLADKRARERMLATLSAQIQKQRREIARLQRDERTLTQLVQRLDRLTQQAARARAAAQRAAKPDSGSRQPAAASQTPAHSGRSFSALKGRLRLPVAGELSNRFGAPRQGGTSWKGLFIRARQGAPVQAVAAGQVVFAEWLRGFGNLVIVDHGEGYMSLYSNNESLYKQVGERVQAGDAIAAVGNSGGQPETGLYFEMRHQSRPVNPLLWVK
jgi:septal ring factor EnvC (AmiA/AmiB activator)